MDNVGHPLYMFINNQGSLVTGCFSPSLGPTDLKTPLSHMLSSCLTHRWSGRGGKNGGPGREGTTKE